MLDKLAIGIIVVFLILAVGLMVTVVVAGFYSSLPLGFGALFLIVFVIALAWAQARLEKM